MTAASSDTRVMPISDHSRIADARRQIDQIAERLDFDATRRGQLEIVASELATNIHLHAHHGYLLVRVLYMAGVVDGIELMAVDRGPGMSNLQECLRDGFSTAGTAGTGLGAIQRLAQTFDIYTQPGIGTVVLAQLHRSVAPSESRYVVGAVCVALAGETACGDAWTASTTARGARMALADGLGHGEKAAQASQLAMRSVTMSPGQPPTRVLENAHRAIVATRGAAMAVCNIDSDEGTVLFAGVGNVAGAIVSGGQTRCMVSYDGIVGHQMRKTQEFNYPWSKESMLVMHSDGLLSCWNFDATPGLTRRHPGIIAAVLHRDFTRELDDFCVVVLRERA